MDLSSSFTMSAFKMRHTLPSTRNATTVESIFYLLYHSYRPQQKSMDYSISNTLTNVSWESSGESWYPTTDLDNFRPVCPTGTAVNKCTPICITDPNVRSNTIWLLSTNAGRYLVIFNMEMHAAFAEVRYRLQRYEHSPTALCAALSSDIRTWSPFGMKWWELYAFDLFIDTSFCEPQCFSQGCRKAHIGQVKELLNDFPLWTCEKRAHQALKRCRRWRIFNVSRRNAGKRCSSLQFMLVVIESGPARSFQRWLKDR